MYVKIKFTIIKLISMIAIEIVIFTDFSSVFFLFSFPFPILSLDTHLSWSFLVQYIKCEENNE